MISNLDKYKKDLSNLILRGEMLESAIQAECFPKEFGEHVKKAFGRKAKKFTSVLPSFSKDYQAWYSETQVLIKQLLPNRFDDFVRYYEKPKNRKAITFESYRLEDCLQGLTVTRGWDKEKVAGPEAAIPLFRQQLAILKSCKSRFESSLFDIRQLVLADVFDNELDKAKELAKNGFFRASGAVAGVVLEKHLSEVCDYHVIKITKNSPTIGDLNDALKQANVIDIVQWRFIQHLADIRNLCDHNKKLEPTHDQVEDLITGVSKILKTLF